MEFINGDKPMFYCILKDDKKREKLSVLTIDFDVRMITYTDGVERKNTTFEDVDLFQYSYTEEKKGIIKRIYAKTFF